MMEVSLDKVRRLREETLARILDCKKALVETKGDLEEAKRILNGNLVNKERVAASKPPANSIWLWGQGRPISLPSFKE